MKKYSSHVTRPSSLVPGNWVAAHTSNTPAPEVTVTVAPFRAWRGSRLIVAGEPAQAAIDWNSGGILSWQDKNNLVPRLRIFTAIAP